MSNRICFYTRVRIKQGEFEAFLEAAKRFVKAVESEPGAISCSAYFDEDKRTVVWVEQFEDANAFLAHFEHPQAKEMAPDLIPRVEEFERVDVYGNVPDEIINGMREQGMPVASFPEHAAYFAAPK